MFQMMANKDTLRRWYIHDLEQEFCGTSSNLNFLPHTTGEGIVEIVALWEMLERSGRGPQLEIAIWCYVSYRYLSGIGMLGDSQILFWWI